MPSYRLTNRAAIDIAGIADYTIERFGIDQARHYRVGLEACFECLGENPLLGRSAEEFGANLKRFKHESHTVFYALAERGVLIVRVLHERMDVPSHLKR